ncbi:microtubule-associated protein futsch-like [Ambystoma mexicanum]|uniref:microtubule-associated protein futsch-like n=1 Tax=Ambystoma mexicanum TaxID=8296 RepID=UPI0037E8F8EC
MEKKGVVGNSEGNTSSIEIARVTTKRQPKKEKKNARTEEKLVPHPPPPRDVRKPTPRRNIKKGSSNTPSEENMFPTSPARNGRKQLPDIEVMKEYSRRYVKQDPSEISIREKELTYRSSLDLRKPAEDKKNIFSPGITKELMNKIVMNDQNIVSGEDKGTPHSSLRDASKQLPDIEYPKENSRRYVKQDPSEENIREKELTYRSSLDLRKPHAGEKKKIPTPRIKREAMTRTSQKEQNIVNREDKGVTTQTVHRNTTKQARDGPKGQHTLKLAPLPKGFSLPKIRLEPIDEKKEEKAPILCPPINANRKTLNPDQRKLAILSPEEADLLFKTQESNDDEANSQDNEEWENEQHTAVLLGTKSTEKILPRLDIHVKTNGKEVLDIAEERTTTLLERAEKMFDSAECYTATEEKEVHPVDCYKAMECEGTRKDDIMDKPEGTSTSSTMCFPLKCAWEEDHPSPVSHLGEDSTENSPENAEKQLESPDDKFNSVNPKDTEVDDSISNSPETAVIDSPDGKGHNLKTTDKQEDTLGKPGDNSATATICFPLKYAWEDAKLADLPPDFGLVEEIMINLADIAEKPKDSPEDTLKTKDEQVFDLGEGIVPTLPEGGKTSLDSPEDNGHKLKTKDRKVSDLSEDNVTTFSENGEKQLKSPENEEHSEKARNKQVFDHGEDSVTNILEDAENKLESPEGKGHKLKLEDKPVKCCLTILGSRVLDDGSLNSSSLQGNEHPEELCDGPKIQDDMKELKQNEVSFGEEPALEDGLFAEVLLHEEVAMTWRNKSRIVRRAMIKTQRKNIAERVTEPTLGEGEATEEHKEAESCCGDNKEARLEGNDTPDALTNILSHVDLLSALDSPETVAMSPVGIVECAPGEDTVDNKSAGKCFTLRSLFYGIRKVFRRPNRRETNNTAGDVRPTRLG